MKVLRKLNQQSDVPLGVGGEGEEKGKDGPQVLIWTWGQATYNTKRRAAVGWRKERSDVLNLWKVMGLWESR